MPHSPSFAISKVPNIIITIAKKKVYSTWDNMSNHEAVWSFKQSQHIFKIIPWQVSLQYVNVQSNTSIVFWQALRKRKNQASRHKLWVILNQVSLGLRMFKKSEQCAIPPVHNIKVIYIMFSNIEW